MVSGRVPVFRLLLAALTVLGLTLVLNSPASAGPPVKPIFRDPGDAHVVVPFLSDFTIKAELPDDSNDFTVQDHVGNYLNCVGTVHVDDSGGVECNIKDYYSVASAERLEGTTQRFTLYGSVGSDLSDPEYVTVDFAESRLKVVSDKKLPAKDTLVLDGEREFGDGVELFTVNWTLKKGSNTLVDDEACVTKDSRDRFKCTYDSTPSRTTAVSPALFLHATASSRSDQAALVLPALVPSGSYTASFNEYKAGVLIDTTPFSFTVGDPPPPGGGGSGGDGDEPAPVIPIPLAPTPTEPPPEPVPDPTPAPQPTPVPTENPDEALPPLPTPDDDDVLRILILAVIAFTVMAMSGARGIGLPRRLSESPIAAGPQVGLHRGIDDVRPSGTSVGGVALLGVLGGAGVDGADDDAGRARPFGDAWGDRSITWRFPGWKQLDALSFAAPVWLASRLPLVSRIAADGSYLRAAFGALWAVLPVGGLVLGAVAAAGGGAAPLPPAVGLVAALLVLAVVDASAGIAAVLAFSVVTLARSGLTAEGLSLSQGVRGLLGLAALWFIAPLVAAAARPLRRAAEPSHVYSWDRFGDTVIAALVSGWAVQGIVGSLGDLTGRDLAITSHADRLALLTIAAVIGRFLLEEAAAALYPRRLQAVQDHGELPQPSTVQQVRGLVVRAGLLAFFAGAFLGNCWQLWAGVAIFAIPQVLQLLGDRIPDVRSLAVSVPRGVVQTLVLVLLGTAIAYLVDSRGSDDQLSAIRLGFVLLAIPGAVLEILSVFGGDAPKPRWTWPKQLAGAAVVAITAALVLFLL